MRRLTILLVLALLAVAGCGGDDEKASGSGEKLTLAADAGALKFDRSELTAKPGKVTITMDNPSDIPHAVSIEGNGVDVDGKTVTKGGKSVAAADLKAGTYDFYCPVGNHRAAGMEGKLTVK